jgi:alpha-glucosidase (family GH31 glycosyl hydrolase)
MRSKSSFPPALGTISGRIRAHTDAEKIKLLPKLDELPVYVRAGTILPMQPVTVSPKEIRLGDESIKDWHYDESTHSVTVLVPNSLSDWTVNLATP